MNRKLARENVYKLIFGYLFTGEADGGMLDEIESSEQFDKADLRYIHTAFNGVIDKKEELEEIIAKYSKGFLLERIYKPDLAVLLLAVYEMKYMPDIPLKVSIAECVALVKTFSTTKSYSFVNGILASVYKELNGDE